MKCSIYQLGNDIRPEGWNALFLYKGIHQNYKEHKDEIISILDRIDKSIKHDEEKFVEQEKWLLNENLADNIIVRLTDDEYTKFRLMCRLEFLE